LIKQGCSARLFKDKAVLQDFLATKLSGKASKQGLSATCGIALKASLSTKLFFEAFLAKLLEDVLARVPC